MEDQKNVDQNWKEQVAKEKTQAKDNNQIYHEPTFTIFLSSLVMQAMIALGKLENPLTHKSEHNPQQARFVIDTISLLQGKCKGNLTEEENKLLDESLYNLRMIYLNEAKQQEA